MIFRPTINPDTRASWSPTVNNTFVAPHALLTAVKVNAAVWPPMNKATFTKKIRVNPTRTAEKAFADERV
jgi:hypothetical protein